MMLESMSKLSENDSQVLAALFDPEASLGSKNESEQSEMLSPDDSHGSPLSTAVLIQEKEALHLLNSQNPSLEDIEKALDKLSLACKQAPNYASIWCNRAQATRLYLIKSYSCLRKDVEHEDLSRIGRENPVLVQRIFSDLNTAINLATPSKLSSQSSALTDSHVGMPSASQARMLAAAHTHRGFLLWQYSRGSSGFNAKELPHPFTGMSAQTLEERASHEFALGGRYGSEIAKRVSVQTNPYAKLCGSIVREAMLKEMENDNCRSGNVRIDVG